MVSPEAGKDHSEFGAIGELLASIVRSGAEVRFHFPALQIFSLLH